MEGLAVGRIVHVRLPHATRPAIVTTVLDHEKGRIRAQIFADPGDPPGAVIDEKTGLEYAMGLDYSEEPSQSVSWCWPPRA